MDWIRKRPVSPAMFGLTAIAILACTVLSTELIYQAGLANTPGNYRKMFAGPIIQRGQHADAAGPWADRVREAVVAAYWSKPELLPALEAFRVAASNFNNLLTGPDGKLGEEITRVPPDPTLQAALALLSKREHHFSELAKIAPPELSRSDPAKERATLSADEKRILEIGATIRRAKLLLFIDGRRDPLENPKPLPATDKDRLSAQHKEARTAFREYNDAYLNPLISTATLTAFVEDSFKTFAEECTEEFAKIVNAIFDAKDDRERFELGEQAKPLVARAGIFAADLRGQRAPSQRIGQERDKKGAQFVGKVAAKETDSAQARDMIIDGYSDLDIVGARLNDAIGELRIKLNRGQ